MKLADYLQKRGIKRIHFARVLGISPSYLTQLCADPSDFWPGRDVAFRIRAATGGEVTPNDFLPPYEAAA